MATKSKSAASAAARALERGGALCVAFVNTGVPHVDARRREPAPPKQALYSYDDLVVWSQRMGVLGAAGAGSA